MSKRLAAKFKINRRLGLDLWGRAKSPVHRREYGPGQHGQHKGKPTDYGTQLLAKQKLKAYYGNVSENRCANTTPKLSAAAATRPKT